MTYWKNESQDTVKIEFDIGKGFRELISLHPEQVIELPANLDHLIPQEAPQLKVIEIPFGKVETNVVVFPEATTRKKPGRKPKDKQ